MTPLLPPRNDRQRAVRQGLERQLEAAMSAYRNSWAAINCTVFKDAPEFQAVHRDNAQRLALLQEQLNKWSYSNG